MVNYTIVACQRKKGSLISEAIYAQHVLCSTSARCQKPHGFVSLKVVKIIQNSCSAVYTALLIGENPGHVTFIYKESCDNMTVAHCFPFAEGSNGILV